MMKSKYIYGLSQFRDKSNKQCK